MKFFLRYALQRLPDYIFLQIKKSDPTSPNHLCQATGPAESDFYLRSIFGDGYMSPPPPEQKYSHSVRIDTDRPCAKERDAFSTE